MNTISSSIATDIAEAFELAGLETHTSRWGHRRATVGDFTVQVTGDDGAAYVTVFTGHDLIVSELTVTGHAVNPVALAGIIAAVVPQ